MSSTLNLLNTVNIKIYILLQLFESIELLHPLEVNCMEMMNSDSMGVMVGWTEQVKIYY